MKGKLVKIYYSNTYYSPVILTDLGIIMNYFEVGSNSKISLGFEIYINNRLVKFVTQPYSKKVKNRVIRQLLIFKNFGYAGTNKECYDKYGLLYDQALTEHRFLYSCDYINSSNYISYNIFLKIV